jgi:hypothetical protein
MTYEEHLDEVTTLITEKYDGRSGSDRHGHARPSRRFFSGHDDDPSICTLDRAHQDARAVYKKYK